MSSRAARLKASVTPETYEAIAGVELRGGKARCPLHEDENPSFSVFEHEEALLWKCHAGCGSGDILDLVQRLRGCSFGDALDLLEGVEGAVPVTGKEARTKDRKPKPFDPDEVPAWRKDIPSDAKITPYDRKSADGTVVARKVRYDYEREGKNEKSCVWCYPSAASPTGWFLGKPNSPVPLYGLPSMNGTGEIDIHEGEKCVDAGRWLGRAGVTAGGVNEFDPAMLDALLTNVSVLNLFPDHDDAGRECMESIRAAALSRGFGVRWIELDRPEKGDIADWLKAHPDWRDNREQIADELARIVGDAPVEHQKAAPGKDAGVVHADFVAYMPEHKYIFIPSRDLWPATSVDTRLPPVRVEKGKGKTVKASKWLDQNRPVEQMTWSPGESMLIEGRLVSNGGWIDRPGCTVLNMYRPPTIADGDPAKATPWLDHVCLVYPDDGPHILQWLGQRVQSPEVKVNHALVLGGQQGVGKDTILEPVKYAVGPWNFSEVSPAQLLGRFNAFVKSVILRVSEARDLGDVNRYAFYDHLKAYTAAPPDVLRCDEKNIREYAVFNVTGVVITSNHKSDGIYLPADDRRHYVAWSDLSKEALDQKYWNGLYRWFDEGGKEHVAAYLRTVDLSGFDPKAPPPKTAAFWEIVDANRAPEDDELHDALDALGWPPATTINEVARGATDEFAAWLHDLKNRRRASHRMEAAGYVRVHNDGQKDGRWKVSGKNVVIYAKGDLSVRDRVVAARRFAEGGA